jgi:hypothetical protein
VFRIEDMKELLNLGYALFIKGQAARGVDDVSDIDRFPSHGYSQWVMAAWMVSGLTSASQK